MNAAERFFQASRARDLESAIAELADGVEMRNPGNEEVVRGRQAVAAVLHAVDAACDDFEHTHLLGTVGGASELYALVFRARLGETTLEGVDLLRLDDEDRIAAFTVAMRPATALMALGARMGLGRVP